MKKINLLLLAFIAIGNFTSAQVGIGTTNPATSAILDLNASDKGLLLNQVTLSDVSVPVDGMLVYDKVAQCVKAYQAGVWSGCIDSGTTTEPTITGLECANAVFNPSILTEGTAYSGTMTVPYTGGNGAFYPASSTISSTGVTGLTATLETGVLNTGSGTLTYTVTGTPTSSGTAVFPISFGGQSCSVSVVVNAATAYLPAGMVITNLEKKLFIASIFDTDYAPYTTPTTVANTNVTAADGITDTTIDLQGIIGTLASGYKTVSLTYVSSTTGVAYSAFSQTVSVPVAYIEGGVASIDLTLSYPAGTTTATGTITATISAASTLNVKKLDINSGLGVDGQGVTIATFTLPSSSSTTGNVTVHAITGIPDAQFGNADGLHDLLYTPVQSSTTGKIWLNNNIGAEYSDTKSSYFDPSKQAQSGVDYLAYGDLFQWGRIEDGHELINRTSSTAATPVNSTLATTQSPTVTPGHNKFITFGDKLNDWTSLTPRTTPNGRWQQVGTTNVNNPCPSGFRVPNNTEWQAEINGMSELNAAGAYGSFLRLTKAGERTTAGAFIAIGVRGEYWSSIYIPDGTSGNGIYTHELHFTDGASSTSYLTTRGTYVNYGKSVRCIQN